MHSALVDEFSLSVAVRLRQSLDPIVAIALAAAGIHAVSRFNPGSSQA